jgi:TetR/AcrR family transcriptional regulator, cholesterol catabolism regulator
MTRDDILDAAAQVFRQKGFHGSSMADIAEAVNLQKASLYHHVTSKQEILLALLDRALDLLYEHIAPITREDLPEQVKLERMMEAYLQAMTENIDLSAVLLLEHRSLEPELHSRHVPNRDRFEELWRDVIRQGVKEGIFRQMDPGMAARALLGIMNWVITWYQPDGKMSIGQITDHYADLFLRGLLSKEP